MYTMMSTYPAHRVWPPQVKYIKSDSVGNTEASSTHTKKNLGVRAVLHILLLLFWMVD